MLMRALLTAAVIAIGFGYVQPSLAAEPGMAVMDMQRMLSESKAALSIQQQIQQRREKFQEEFSKLEQELSITQKSLGEEKATLSQEEFAKKRTAYEKRLSDARNLVLKRKNTLDQGAGAAAEKLRKEIVAVVDALASEKNYGVVLNTQSVVLSEKGMDITDEVMARLDKAIPNIQVNFQE